MLLERRSRSSTDSTLLIMLPPCDRRTHQLKQRRPRVAVGVGAVASCAQRQLYLRAEEYSVAVHFDNGGVSVSAVRDLERQARCVLRAPAPLRQSLRPGTPEPLCGAAGRGENLDQDGLGRAWRPAAEVCGRLLPVAHLWPRKVTVQKIGKEKEIF